MNLRVEGLGKRFGGLVAVDSLTFEYDGRAPLGIIGPNGSGKTTLFNLMTGFVATDAGSVRMDDVDLTTLPPHRIARAGIRRTFQQVMVFRGQTVRESLAVGLDAIAAGDRRGGVLHDEPAALESLLDLCKLTEHADRIADELPFGHARLLGIAMALTGPCRLLLLDEPAAGMSDAEAGVLASVVLELARRRIGVILVDHNTRFLFDLCDRVLVLDKGRLIAEGSPGELRGNAKVISAYLGVARA